MYACECVCNKVCARAIGARVCARDRCACARVYVMYMCAYSVVRARLCACARVCECATYVCAHALQVFTCTMYVGGCDCINVVDSTIGR